MGIERLRLPLWGKCPKQGYFFLYQEWKSLTSAMVGLNLHVIAHAAKVLSNLQQVEPYEIVHYEK